jgi:hypothetical protein
MDLSEFSAIFSPDVRTLEKKLQQYWRVSYLVDGQLVEWHSSGNEIISLTSRYFDSKEKAEAYASESNKTLDIRLYGSIVDGMVHTKVSQCTLEDLYPILHSLTLSV